MTYDELIEAMTPDMHTALKRAVELGKWPDGRRLTEQQRDICLRAVIAYDQKMPEEQRVGFISRKKKNGAEHGKDPLQPEVLKILTNS